MSVLMAMVGTILCAFCAWLLFTTVMGACTGMINLLACIGLVVFAVVAADGWYKLLADKVQFKKK